MSQGCGIRTQASAGLQFAAEILQLLFRNSAFKISTRIHAGSGVPLEVNDVAVAALRLRAEEMIEGNFIQRRSGGKRRDVPADAFLNFVGADDHRQRVPANQALDAAFHLLAAGKRRLLT